MPRWAISEVYECPPSANHMDEATHVFEPQTTVLDKGTKGEEWPPDVLCDSSGWLVTKGYDYKIRIRVGGSELGMYAKDWSDKTLADNYRLTAGPAGSGSLFYIESDGWASGKKLQLRAKTTTWSTFESRTDMYTNFASFGNENKGLCLTTTLEWAAPLLGIAGTESNIFLGQGSNVGLRVISHWGPESGWHYVNADFTGAYLDVQFVRMPKV
ncbi:hypothetical protein B0T26DRAFT_680012 [Lasiosphaeria miniovina]|uniref:Uncharacterized protein n=1 Tax=Lasiosphaeria miniovina TaxID=1954250 RepID=A0AA40DJW0_9PEZI|nr:uncharacterized protein B0T26DRAFT_680012 [Lasiosphaeria miniovina]KAK0706309.1 hypothetical protein B0T26DRAFT_680012 [Lasiosphaeria miniovina]